MKEGLHQSDSRYRNDGERKSPPSLVKTLFSSCLMRHMVHNRKVFIDDKHILIFSMLINLRLDNVSRGEAVMLPAPTTEHRNYLKYQTQVGID